MALNPRRHPYNLIRVMPAKGRTPPPLTVTLAISREELPSPLWGGRAPKLLRRRPGGGNPNGRESPTPNPSPQGGGEPAMPGGERDEQDCAIQGPDGAEGHDRTDQRLHQGLLLA